MLELETVEQSRTAELQTDCFFKSFLTLLLGPVSSVNRQQQQLYIEMSDRKGFRFGMYLSFRVTVRYVFHTAGKTN